MRYAVFTDVHANLEALEAVLAKIDELAKAEPIDQIWFLGDLVGYGPNPNECIDTLRERTNVIIAGNHDWAAVGKLDLDDFSPAARTSAEWTAEQLTEEHSEFLKQLPERLQHAECTLVHGSPYGPLWEYLTSEVLAERSFEHFTSRFCFVGHTHVPIIFQQQDTIEQTPTIPLTETEQHSLLSPDETFDMLDEDDEETQKVAAIRPMLQAAKENTPVESALGESEDTAHSENGVLATLERNEKSPLSTAASVSLESETVVNADETPLVVAVTAESPDIHDSELSGNEKQQNETSEKQAETEEGHVGTAEERLNSEIEELLALLGLSQSMVQVTNEMVVPPEGEWAAPKGYRAIVNAGGVGQPRDGDSRAAFMIYDTKRGFTFYRVQYDYEKTQEKIIQAGLPPYLAARLEYGR